MSINAWSDSILLVDLHDEPVFSEDMDALNRRLDDAPAAPPDVVIDAQGLSYMNSSNIAQLLRIRKKLVDRGSRLRLCSLNEHVWSTLLMTGLDKIFDCTGDVSTSLASLQLDP